MCFSPQADLVGGAIIGAIGIDALRHVERRPSHFAIAALPLILAFHQFDEAFIWLGLEGHVPKSVEHLALWIYLIIAFVVLPIYVPLAILGYEPTIRRKWAMSAFVTIGIFVSAVLLHAMLRGPFGVAMRPFHLSYNLRLGHATLIVGLYVVAVCGAFLFSGVRPMVVFGLINLVAVIVIVVLSVDGFASVWCAWAAISSGAIALRLRLQERQRLDLTRPLNQHDLPHQTESLDR
ncbi:MAG TPA: DUF6629 family protein [Acidimicrobiales bacterium]|nr:DUF6629 family protein [Acidimicrobiales bacterium]